jgi:Family of unknown function (DUF6156)
MLTDADWERLGAADTALIDALTLVEGIERDELSPGRVTTREVRRKLRAAAEAITSLAEEARRLMPELDAPAWERVRDGLDGGLELASDGGWQVLQVLVPTTAGWLRFHRERHRELRAAAAEAYRYFVTYSGARLPLRLVNPLEESELTHRNTFIRARYDDSGRLSGFDKVVYGKVELSHRYSYYASGALRRAVIESPGEQKAVEFDEAGSPSPAE